MENDEKVCPRCAETVKSAALVCKHCQYEFGTPLKPAESHSSNPSTVALTPPKKKRPVMIGCLAIIAIIVVIGVIGSQVGPSNNSSNNSGTPDASAPAPIAVTSVQLAEAYSANEVAAQNTYGDKTLDVTGIVTGVTLDFMNDPVLQMQSVNQFLPVQASFDKSFKDKLAAYAKGERVTVRCTKITEVISAPMLSDCSIP